MPSDHPNRLQIRPSALCIMVLVTLLTNITLEVLIDKVHDKWLDEHEIKDEVYKAQEDFSDTMDWEP